MKKPISHKLDTSRFTLRLSPDLFAVIDAECARRVGKVSRNTWIAEAIQEKLDRSNTNTSANGGIIK